MLTLTSCVVPSSVVTASVEGAVVRYSHLSATRVTRPVTGPKPLRYAATVAVINLPRLRDSVQHFGLLQLVLPEAWILSGELIVSKYVAESITMIAGRFGHECLCQLRTERCTQLTKAETSCNHCY